MKEITQIYAKPVNDLYCREQQRAFYIIDKTGREKGAEREREREGEKERENAAVNLTLQTDSLSHSYI